MPTDTSLKTTTHNMVQTKVDIEAQVTARHARNRITLAFLFNFSVPLPV